MTVTSPRSECDAGVDSSSVRSSYWGYCLPGWWVVVRHRVLAHRFSLVWWSFLGVLLFFFFFLQSLDWLVLQAVTMETTAAGLCMCLPVTVCVCVAFTTCVCVLCFSVLYICMCACFFPNMHIYVCVSVCVTHPFPGGSPSEAGVWFPGLPVGSHSGQLPAHYGRHPGHVWHCAVSLQIPHLCE